VKTASIVAIPCAITHGEYAKSIYRGTFRKCIITVIFIVELSAIRGYPVEVILFGLMAGILF
jgi:hypothetical protein